MPYKPLSVQKSDEDKLYRRYWTGVKGEPMTVSKRQLDEKLDRSRQHARDTFRFIEKVILPTSDEIKEGELWDEEVLEELDEVLDECKSDLYQLMKKIDRLTKPYRTNPRHTWNKNKTVECPECGHEFNLKGRPKKDEQS
jgi:DNA-directed RNA polymerase subunit RPC12/RpoP